MQRSGPRTRARALSFGEPLRRYRIQAGRTQARLAVELAERVVDHFSEGVLLVELASLRDPELVPQAVAAALGIPEQAGSSVRDVLTDAIRSRALLLVLDNCEPLVQACAELV